MTIGNDVVDLADPEAQPAALHARFDDRVFSTGERELLERAASRHVMRWTLWAAKESAYKARKRLEPETVFSPREFVAELPPLPRPDRRTAASGRVLHRGRATDVEVRLAGTSVHAIARIAPAPRARLLSRIETTDSEPGVAARRLATVAIAAALGLDRLDIAICDRPPVARYRGLELDLTVSLSHHGRFVAFACVLPQPVTLVVDRSARPSTMASPVTPGGNIPLPERG